MRMNIFKKWRQVHIDRAAANAMACIQNDYAGLLLRLLESDLPPGAKRRSVLTYWITFRDFTRRQNTKAAQQSRRTMRPVFLSVLRDLRRKKILSSEKTL